MIAALAPVGPGRGLGKNVMNKLLCAGGAAIALAAASPAAAAGFDIKIGGDADFTAGYVSQSYDTSGQPKGDFTNRFRINITPTATADNGMEYGASLRFRAYAGNGTIDAQRAYLFADGGLGRVEAGVIAGPNSRYGITAPTNFGTGGVVGEWAMGTGWLTNQNTFLEPAFGDGFDAITDTTWATRINYFTPRFFAQSEDAAGLMGALSFAPRILDIGASANRVRTIRTTGQSYCAATLPSTPLSGCGYRNVVEAGLNALVAADHPISATWVDEAILDSNPDMVRTLSVKPPRGSGRIRLVRIGADAAAPVDLQPCGGTHVARTGQIGRLVVGKIENKGKQNRRITLSLAD